MLVRAIRCFTDKTMNDKKGGVRWKGDVFEVNKKRADELFKHNAIEEVVEEPEPEPETPETPNGGGQDPADNPGKDDPDE